MRILISALMLVYQPRLVKVQHAVSMKARETVRKMHVHMSIGRSTQLAQKAGYRCLSTLLQALVAHLFLQSSSQELLHPKGCLARIS